MSYELVSTISADSTSTSMTITDVFSENYNIYKVVSNLHANTANNESLFVSFVDALGSPITSSNYETAHHMNRAYNVELDRPTSKLAQTNMYVWSLSSSNEGGGGCVAWVFQPYSTSSYTYLTVDNVGNAPGSGVAGTKGIGVLKLTTQVTGLYIYSPNNYNFNANSKISIYGVKEE